VKCASWFCRLILICFFISLVASTIQVYIAYQNQSVQIHIKKFPLNPESYGSGSFNFNV